MTKEARTAKPVRATRDEWAEIDRARGGQSRQDFMLDAALGVARGGLVPKPAKAGRSKQPSKVTAVTPLIDGAKWNRVTSLGHGSPPRPKGNTE